jgi:hypothetical protein
VESNSAENAWCASAGAEIDNSPAKASRFNKGFLKSLFDMFMISPIGYG